MIAVAAYYRGERYGFASGDPIKDWWEAAAEVDAMQSVRNALRLWSESEA